MVIGHLKASCNNGCWMIGVSKVDEYDDFPDWNMRLRERAGAGYSLALEMNFRREISI